ncbi:hypothetical protein COL922a_008807 [Colletotrichum nupharicola]|nr:hypothetical protein COL922a_008807 [Colletotrichum nupharicola]
MTVERWKRLTICWDTSSWTAICLVDSYFKSQTDAEDPYMLPHYAKDPDDDDPDLDPLSIGKLTADKVAAVDPREYFLLIIKVRIMRLREIWMNVVYHLGQRINQYMEILRLWKAVENGSTKFAIF